ncbi:helix-turn-helix transcriptional regulator [Burkholderia sp. Tr-20390]|uniref:helix-turn-helix transcriptional regulator n=1 Tax=Burkholderia sp. Tr-20390 TaxID=2703904 RepID=UPI00197E0162|nr:helix-turn-helix transcriptional regulator [Burkholderia sp. Tr-20390]MBN3733984.1 helix-turn-helix transcriptional regulator [Burkholderia sp. Tr-20390]
MNLSASDITPEELRLFGDIVARLEELGPVVDVRTVVLPAITQLLRADFAASFDCDEHTGLWRNGFAYNVDASQIARYEAWFQHIDPVTPPLRARRVATCVDEVVSRRELEQTEFYTDFLCRDGMHHGINVYAFDGATHVGDLRIWRAQGRPDFTERDKLLLNGIEPFFRRALLRRRHACAGLTGRESDVARLVAAGYTDKDVARTLGIGVPTVRTHLRRVMAKKGVPNRASLAAALA